MKIFLNEITEEGTHLDFSQDDAWVADAVARVDEKLDGDAPRPPSNKPRQIKTSLSIHKVDEVVVISGKIRTDVQLVCSRCANFFALPTSPNFSALFCKDPVMAGVGHFSREAGVDKPAGKNRGFARHAHDKSLDTNEDDGLSSTKDIDITYISQDSIELADVLTEQLQLQIPFQPLCKEDCKGMCAQCGADLNVGRCACAKLTSTQPFSVLKDLKFST